jgi:5-(carboxyamino)imidazole ribonucleotide mutase
MAERKKVAVIMGSGSDAATMQAAIGQLEALNIAYEAHVMSAHRSPQRAADFASGAREQGFGVIIAAAGKAAHLAGVLAAHTTLPVVGVPIRSQDLGGMDALLSTVQMPSGVPVATVAIDGAKNAALLAAQILAVTDADLAKRLSELKLRMEADVLAQDRALFDSSN